MNDQPLALAWFRQDLRLADNPALRAAAEAGRVIPIYILDDESAGDWAMGAASRAWLHHSLQSLDRQLDGKLRCFAGNAADIIASLAQSLPLAKVCWNRCYEPWRQRRDAAIEAALGDAGI
jgi:deoxyribodipyrimidine photo-lyase